MRITLVRQYRRSKRSFLSQPKTTTTTTTTTGTVPSTIRRFNGANDATNDGFVVVESPQVLISSFPEEQNGNHTKTTTTTTTTSATSMIPTSTKPPTNTIIPSKQQRPSLRWIQSSAALLSNRSGSSLYSSCYCPVVSRRYPPFTENHLCLLRSSFTTTSVATDATTTPSISEMTEEESHESNSQTSVAAATTAAAAAATTSEMFPTASSIFKNPSHNKLNLLLHVNMDDLQEMASKRCTPLSLKDMYKYAVKDVNNPEQRMWNAQFLHKE
jgi:hypothetical protein